ncbi:MAG: hypothetical protein AB1485_00620 [Candidatus Thermoplasmatota archaeon]
MNLDCKEVSVNGKKIFLVGVIEPISEEAKRVKAIIEKISPDLIALQISQEELEYLKSAELEKEKFYLSLEQEIYARKLAVYDEVVVPWAYLETVLSLCSAKAIPLEAVDFTEEEFAKEFIKTISPITLIRQNLRLRRIKKKKFRAKSAIDFVCEWDKVVTKLKGYKELTLKREECIAIKIIALLDKATKILGLVELQRIDGIEQKLRQLLSSRQQRLE